MKGNSALKVLAAALFGPIAGDRRRSRRRLRGCSRAAKGGRPRRRSRRRAEQTCELRNGPTRPQGGAAPKKRSYKTAASSIAKAKRRPALEERLIAEIFYGIDKNLNII